MSGSSLMDIMNQTPYDITNNYTDSMYPQYTSVFNQQPSVSELSNNYWNSQINPTDNSALVQYTNPDFGSLRNDYMNAEINHLNNMDNILLKQENSWQNQYLKPASQALSALSSLGNLFLGYKQYGLAKQQMGLAKEKWNMTKDELNRIKGLRSKLTKQYMGA